VTCLLNEDTSPEGVFLQFLKNWYALEPRAVFPCLYFHTGPEAIRHLYRVASSLDSLVVGEPQILGQVKDAMHAARQAGCLNTQLGSLLEKSIGVGRFAMKLKLTFPPFYARFESEYEPQPWLWESGKPEGFSKVPKGPSFPEPSSIWLRNWSGVRYPRALWGRTLL
jgi:hypothetical protein